MKNSVALAALVITATLTITPAAFAEDEYNVTNGITLTGNQLGMHGFDPVSVIDTASPQLGNAVYTSAYDGVDYYFATKVAQQKFEADPAAYLPQFGGFCAYGVFVGKKLDGDVRFADVVDGKLYLFVNAAVFGKYLANREEVLKVAYDKWPGIRATAISDL